MFIGKYYYKLQQNARISVPKEFSKEVPDWIVTRGLDGCLFMFPAEKFTQELNQIASNSLTKKANRDLTRIMTNEAKLVTADNNGRVHLPQYLIDYAHLTQDIVVVGSFNRVEIWDQTNYHHYSEQLENQAEVIAEQIND